MSSSERGRGILTEADRRYLRGETTYGSEQAERNARSRIRERLAEALGDFQLLVDELSERDRELAVAQRLGGDDTVRAYCALVDAIAFLYRACDDVDASFETLLKDGVDRALAEDGRSSSVSLDVRVETLAVSRLRRRLAAGETLSLHELSYLRERDEVGLEELADYFDRDAERPDDRNGEWVQAEVSEF